MDRASRLPGPPLNAVPATPSAFERLIRDIRRVTRKHDSAKDKIWIVLDGLRGEVSIAKLASLLKSKPDVPKPLLCHAENYLVAFDDGHLNALDAASKT